MAKQKIQDNEADDNWHYPPSDSEIIGFGINYSEGEIRAVDYSLELPNGRYKESNIYSLNYDKIQDIHKSEFYKYCRRYYRIDEAKGDLQKILTNQLLRALDDVVNHVQDYLREQTEEDKKTKRADMSETEREKYKQIALEILQNSMTTSFANFVFEKLIINEERSILLIWLALIEGDWVKLKGKTCEGKTTLANCSIMGLPQDWILKIGKADPAYLKHKLRESVQSDKKYKVLYLQEISALSEYEQLTIRNLSKDDGGISIGFTTKGNTDSNYFAGTDEIHLPPMAVLTTTTQIIFDGQDSSREWSLSPDGSVEQTTAILGGKTKNVRFPWLKDDNIDGFLVLREIARYIHELDVEVVVPLMNLELIRIPTMRATIRREYDRFENIIKVITKANFPQRKSFTINGKRYLISTLADLQQAIKISADVFEMSGTGLDETTKKVYDILRLVERLAINDSTLNELDTSTPWISTTTITVYYRDKYGSMSQRNINIHLDALAEAGHILKKKKGQPNIWSSFDIVSSEISLVGDFDIIAKEKLAEWYSFFPEITKSELDLESLSQEIINPLTEFRSSDDLIEAFSDLLLGKERWKDAILSERVIVPITSDTSDSIGTNGTNRNSEDFRLKKDEERIFSEKKQGEDFFSSIGTTEVNYKKSKTELLMDILIELQRDSKGKELFLGDVVETGLKLNLEQNFIETELDRLQEAGDIFYTRSSSKNFLRLNK